MRVTLISPYTDLQVFGLRVLSSCLKEAGFDVRILFMRHPFNKSYAGRALKEAVEAAEGSGLVGISVMTNCFVNAAQITKAIKDSLDMPVIWGGIHPTVRPEECLRHADMVCLGEGEGALVELARILREGREHHDVENIWSKKDGVLCKNALRPVIRDLDSIPFQDYLNETHYVLHENSLQRLTDDLQCKYMNHTYLTIPSRGCPFKCSYCCNNALGKVYPQAKAMRKRSVENIIAEISTALRSISGISQIKFADDSFFSYSTMEIEEFSRKYKENISLPLAIGGATPSTLTREKLAPLVKAGLEDIRMGIQTGSERTLKLYNRRQNNHDVIKAAETIHRVNPRLMPRYDIILDNLWETEEDLRETLELLSKLSLPFKLNLFSLTFYPGTDLYEKARADGIITDDIKDVYLKNFLGCKFTYINKLFFLLDEFARKGIRLPWYVISLLLNRRLRSTGAHMALYAPLKLVSYILNTREIATLFAKAIGDILRGDTTRIREYIMRRLQK